MSKPFQVGDRVAVYFYDGRYAGTVMAINTMKQAVLLDALWIDWDKKHPSKWVHSKQCRKLIKKPRRRIWVFYENNTPLGRPYTTPNDAKDWERGSLVEFVEVKRK